MNKVEIRKSRKLKLQTLLFLLSTFSFLLYSAASAQVPARSQPITCVRDDALSTVPQAEGQQTPCRIDANGNIWVNLGTRLDQANDAVSVYGSDDAGTTKRIVKTDSGGAVAVDVESLPALPAGTNNIGEVTTRGANSNAKINCTENTFLNMTTATTTQIVAISGSTIIYVCSFSIVSNGGTATNVKFVGGTGTNCATSQDDRSGAMPLTAATNTVGISRGSGEGMIIKTSTGGDALCISSSGAATLAVDVSYAQF